MVGPKRFANSKATETNRVSRAFFLFSLDVKF